MDLHGQIMNLKWEGIAYEGEPPHYVLAHKMGHRDARHAAAELALKADACIDALRLFVSAGYGNSANIETLCKAHIQACEALAALDGRVLVSG
jgi:hypothetical protein